MNLNDECKPGVTSEGPRQEALDNLASEYRVTMLALLKNEGSLRSATAAETAYANALYSAGLQVKEYLHRVKDDVVVLLGAHYRATGQIAIN